MWCGFVAVALAGGAGEAQTIKLADDGTPPDVKAGDQMWGGGGMLDGDAFSVSVSAGGKVLGKDKVSWTTADARDLTIQVSKGQATFSAGRAPGADKAGGGGGSGSPGPVASGQSVGDGKGGAVAGGGDAAAARGGGQGGAPGASSGGASASVPTVSGPTASGPSASGGEASLTTGGLPPLEGSGGLPGGSGSPKAGGGGNAATVSTPAPSAGRGLGVPLSVGLAALLLGGLGWLAWRNRRESAAAEPDMLAPLPEPPFVGHEFPSLSDGLSVWVAPTEGDAAQLVSPLLATVARDHRVVVVAPPSLTPPRVRGGPVYRTNGTRAAHLGDALDALYRVGGAPVAIFVWGVSDPGLIRDYADELGANTGGVALMSGEVQVAVPTVRAQPQGEEWLLTCQSERLRVHLDAEGFREIG
jgi:hypothetical protein